MGHALLLLLVTIVTQLISCQEVRADLCSQVIAPEDYNCNEYDVTTDDGFVLGIQNIPGSGPPVLLVHGLLGGGDNFCLNSPTESLAYVLADAGYDVWIGNNRCVRWSHGHRSYSSSDSGYWSWTYDELASYDLKAMTEFVYNQRGRLFYVGHSQGALMLLAGLGGGAFGGQVQGYLQGAVLLAPVASTGHVTPTLTKAGFDIQTDKILPALGIGKFDLTIFDNLACTQTGLSASNRDSLNSGILDEFLGSEGHVNTSRFPYYNQFFPGITSSYNIDHYGQSYRGDNFQFYQKGLSKPASYDLSSFPSSLPLQIWSGGLDGLADKTDVANLLGQLPSSNRETHFLSSYGHLDFVLGLQSSSDIYPSMMSFFQAHS